MPSSCSSCSKPWESEVSAIKRIYLVKGGESDALVRAATPAQAIRHVVGTKFSAEVAKQDDIVRLVAAHQEVQVAGDEPPEEPPIPASIRSNRPIDPKKP